MLGVLRVKSHAHWMVVQVVKVKECETRGEQAKGEGKTFEI